MENVFMRMVGSGSGVDWIVVFTLAVVAVLYFLAPVLGYAESSRGMLLISMYVLVAYVAVVLLQVLVQYFCYLVISNADTLGKTTTNFEFLFGLLKLVVFLAATGTFVYGLKSLKRAASAA